MTRIGVLAPVHGRHGRLALMVALMVLATASSANAATITVSSTAQLQSAVSSAANGDVIEVTGGSYGSVTLSTGRSGYVTVRPASGASVIFSSFGFGGTASFIRIEGMTIGSQVAIGQGSAHDIQLVGNDVRGVAVRAGNSNILVEHNDIHDCGNCVEAASVDPTVHGSPCPSCSAQASINNVTLRGNKIVDPGTDAIYVGNFRNLVVQDNEIIGVQENGDHSDCLQSTFGGQGLVYTGNYVHDNRCQGFFIKDGRVTDVTVENNLFARNTKPCGAGVSCDPGSPYTFQVYDTVGITVRNNTFAANAGGETFRERDNSGAAVDHNVFYGFGPFDDQGPDYGDYYHQAGAMTEDFNIGTFASTWPSSYRGSHDMATSSPSFRDPANGDYRLSGPVTAGGASYTPGVDWRVADKQFGRAGVGTGPPPPPPPSDTTPPNTTITSGPSASTSSTSASFGFSSSESGSTFECKLDAGSFASCSSPKAYSALGTGSHTFSVRATDAAGNTDASPATQTWTVTAASDTTPPDTTITSGPGGATNDPTPSVAFTSTETGSTFACRVDSGAWAACTSPWTAPVLADGPHSVSVRATDAAGNADATPATRSFTIDTAAPRTTITSSPPALSLSGSGSVSFSVDEPATSACRLDGGAWTGCTSPYQVSGLGIGSHTVDVRSTDSAGNLESPGASAQWTVLAPVTVAAQAPTVSLVAPTANATISRTLRISADATASSPISRVEFWVDRTRVASDTRAPYTSRVALGSLRVGMHTVTARAFDASGRAASAAELVRVVRGGARAAAASPMARALMSTAAAGPDATRLAGQGARRHTVRVTLTRCDDTKGGVAGRVRMKADALGRLAATRGQAGLCVLSLEPLHS